MKLKQTSSSELSTPGLMLTHAYFLADDEKEQQIMKPYPPLGILYLSGYLKQKEVRHEVFDTTFSTKPLFYEYLLKLKPTVLAIYINLMTKLNVLEMVTFVKNHKELSHTKIVLGGPDVRYNAENLLDFGVDFLVIGEGEETFYEICQKVLNINSNEVSKTFSEIKGLAYKNKKGEIIINPDRPLRKDLDDLPLPNRAAIDLNLYLNAWKIHHGESSMTLSTMRGCPYTCHWCSRGVYGLSYRRRSPEKVVAEIKEVQRQYQADNFWFVDDVFTISHKWLEGFCEELEKQRVKIRYECISRADRMNENVIRLLQKSGCFRIWIGAESGSQKIIDLMDRRVKVEKVQEMIQLTKKAGIQAGTFIMLGYPNETEEDIKNTLSHLKAANPDQFTITLTYPIKGTELYEEVETHSTVNELDWSTSTDRDIDFKRAYSNKYYNHAVHWVVNEMAYYQRKGNTINSLKLKAKSLKARMGMMMEKG
ncbi:radical SAM protein [uncultured Arcticibacterium sp.]|uniref:B12-binding domain-containing radical SAM protein n=1 Tax=uncultured Arcticibacterium sp. TaxID=2173042 RepID=UPI0030FA70FE